MKRWLVRLSGDPLDLDEYCRAFPDGECFAIAENGSFYLAGPAFDALESAEAVYKEAKRYLARYSAALCLLSPDVEKVEVENVFRDTGGGKRQAFVFFSASSLSMRCRVRGNLTVSPSKDSGPTTPQQLLAKAEQEPHLREALRVWTAQGDRSWGRLFRILEEVEGHLGKLVSDGLCSKTERTRFMRTANCAKSAGADARHGSLKFKPPKRPMSLDEGTEFVRRILLAVLQSGEGPLD